MTWLSSGRITNLTLDQVLLDTGALLSGSRTPQIIISSTVAATFEIQYRDAENATTLKSQIIACQAFSVIDVVLWLGLSMSTNERIRVISVTDVVGQVSASILYQD